MNPAALALLGLTALVVALVGATVIVVLRIAGSGQRGPAKKEAAADTLMLSAALQETVTKLRAQERATARRAEASERLSEEVIASLAAGLLVVNLNGEVETLNPAGRRLLGLGNTPHAGVHYRRLLSHAAPVALLIEQCLASGHAIARRTIDMTKQEPGGTHLGASVSPLIGSDSDLQTQGAICLFTDLTSVVALEEQLRLKDSLARVGELTAGIAHEFRNGLATIHGYSRLIELDALPPVFRPYVEGIRAETEAMREVVTNFLNFARPTQLAVSPVDLRAVIERAAEDLRGDARALNGSIEIGGKFPVIEGDDVLLRQAFSNLFRNAIEACAGASIAPAVRADSEIVSESNTCTISITDNGPGFPENARDRVFQPFFTTKQHGTGLGLALVQKIVVTHNGRVSADPAPTGGGRVSVILPITPHR